MPETDPSYHEEVKTRLAAIGTTLVAMDTKLDVLQADMDIIKPWIQALYDDLNP